MRRRCVACAFPVPVDPYTGMCEVCTAAAVEDIRPLEERRRDIEAEQWERERWQDAMAEAGRWD